jgi:ATP-dependent RNA helicase RhlE
MSFSRFHNYRRSNSGFRRPAFGRGKPIKEFNPGHLINAQQTIAPFQPEEITHSFDDFGLVTPLLSNVKKIGYDKPTPIQDQAIPVIMAGKDVIGIANTGTGKTAAFLIPIINKILQNRNEKVLIISPTRELATQIQDEFYKFSREMRILSVLCIGGVNEAPQRYNLRRFYNVVVGTPGRLKDHIQNQYLDLSKFSTIILDEADMMADMGFLPDVKFLLSKIPAQRQSLFFSATMDDRIKEFLFTFVKSPVTISVRRRDILENIQQRLVKIVNPAKKVDQLHNLLEEEEFEKVLIFGRTKHGTQKLSEELVRRGFKADVIHGNKSQNQRQRTLDRFKQNDIKILIATDVASRGLDIPNVSHVINYDLPESSDTYIHRIGRTGRAEQKGVAVTFV